MKILIENTTAYAGDSFERRDNISLLVENGKITAIAPNLPKDNAEVIDGSGYFVTPGFVNSHFHPSQQLNRALGVGLNYDEQMDLLHATDQIKNPEDSLMLSYIAILEGLKSGTTCYYSVGSNIENQFEVFKKLGIRAACAMIPKDISAYDKDPGVRAQTWDTAERLEKAEALHKKFHSELIQVHFGVANVRYASDRLILGMLGLAQQYSVGFQMHAAESEEYVQEVLKRTGHRPVEHLHKIGALSERVSLAHAVHLKPSEIEYIAKAHSHVVHCPRSNSYVGVGVCPVKELLESGVNIALGSDAAINNNSNEVRGEAHAAFDKISDRHHSTDIVDYITFFKMLTINGARAMGIDKEVGTVEAGKQADLVLWSKNDLPFIPGYNHIADLIFTDSCRAHTVLVNGEIVLQNYMSTKIDEVEIKRQAKTVSNKYYEAFQKLHSKRK